MATGDAASIGRRPERRPALIDFLGRNWLMLLAIIPLFRILVLTSPDGMFATWQLSWRIFWLPSLYGELAVICIALLHRMSPARLIGQLSRIFQILIGAWIMALVAASISTRFPGPALVSAIIWTVHLLFACSVVHLVREHAIDHISMARKFCFALAGSTAVAGSAIFLFVILTGVGSEYDWRSSLPGYAHIRHTGYIFAPAIAGGLASLAIWPKFQVRAHWAILLINTTAMLWLGSRGPAVALIVALVICVLFSLHLRNRIFWRRAGSALVTGSILSIILPAPTIGWFGAIQRFWNGSRDPSELSSGRMEVWLETMRLIGEQPWLGYGGFQFQQINTAAEGMYKHPHNGPLQFLFDWGLLGGAAILLLIGFAYVHLLLNKRIESGLRTFGLLGASTMLAFAMLDGILFYNFTIAVTLIFLLLPLASVKSGQTRAHHLAASPPQG